MKFNLVNLIFPISLMFYNGEAQNHSISGRLYIEDIKESGAGIFITNQSTGYTTISDLTGKFVIEAKPSDILFIRSLFTEDRSFTLTPAVFLKKEIFIQLNVKSVELETVTIYPNKLTGYLDKDIRNQKIDMKVERLRDAIGLPERTGNGRIDDEALFSSIVPNVSSIYDIVSGDRRRRNELFEYEDKQKDIVFIREYYTDEYYTGELQIPEEEIQQFIEYCYALSDLKTLVSKKEYLLIQEELKKHADTYSAKKK